MDKYDHFSVTSNSHGAEADMTEQEHVDLQKQIGAVDAKCERILGMLENREDHGKRIDRIERAVFGLVIGMLGLFAKAIFWGKT